MTKKQKSVSIPLEHYQKIEKLFNENADVCNELEISSPSELLRVLSKLGEPRFLEIVAEARRTRKMKKEEVLSNRNNTPN